MLSAFRPKPQYDAQVVDQIRDWVRTVFGLSEDCTILVTEVRCLEEDCPDVETVIGVMIGPGKSYKHKILKPMIELQLSDIQQLKIS